MTEEFTYRDYVTDERFTEQYRNYQKRYVSEARESDKVIIGLVGEILDRQKPRHSRMRLLDAGCSTGNLLSHLRRAFPDLDLVGGDMVPTILEECRNNADLAGISFQELNLLDMQFANSFDFVTINAVLYMFDDSQFEQALRNVFEVLAPTGWLLVFDFFHAFNQDLSILEKSSSHPEGLMLHFRRVSHIRALLERIGFCNVEFRPFSISIDLDPGSTFSDNRDGVEDLNTYTVKDEHGSRMLFRGALHQPWGHLVAQKVA